MDATAPTLLADRPRLDAPKLASRHRLYLPRCLQHLGWQTGQRVRLRISSGRVSIVCDDGAGRPRRIGSGERITLPTEAVRAVGAAVG